MRLEFMRGVAKMKQCVTVQIAVVRTIVAPTANRLLSTMLRKGFGELVNCTLTLLNVM
jgi:hypothetical protein